MKKILLTISAFVLMLSANSQSTPRTVLLEHFTQASCGPCASANPNIRAYMNTTTVSIAQINYQTSWPGVDPMNAHNPTEVQSRVTKYGVSGVPNSVIDGGGSSWGGYNCGPIGTSFSGCPAGGWTNSTFTNREAMMSPFVVEVSSDLSSNLSSVNVSMKIKASDVTSGTYKAYIAVVEKHISFTSAPGSNGETDFYEVFKKFLPSDAGTTLPSSWAVGDSVVINESWTLANVYDKSQLAVVVWVQKSTDEVMQSNTALSALPAGLNLADMSATEAHTLPTDLCATTFTPEVTVTNNSSSVSVDTFQVSYTLNSGTPVTADIYTLIAPGGTYTHTFPQVNLSSGSNTIDYAVNTNQDYSSADLSGSNDVTSTTTINVIPPTAFATDHQEGFESKTNGDAAPDNSIAINPNDIRAYVINGNVNGTGNQLGGHGNSFTSFRWDFFAISSGDESSLVWEKLDFSSNTNTKLVFTHAYAQYNAENDRLVVSASIDCGSTWTDVFDEAGSTLKTVPPVSSGRFYPGSSDWTDNVVDLSAFDGESEVMIRMKGVSAFGNSLYVDDINIFGSSCTVVPSNVSAMPITTTSTEVSWTENNSASEWNIEYGAVGFTPGSGTVENATSNPYTVTGLDPLVDYEFYVTSVCKLGDESDESLATNLTSISSILENSIKIYPNPANEVLNISMLNNSVKVNSLEIVNILGETLINYRVQNDMVSINTEDLNPGIYFVNFKTDNGESVSKKIVIE